MKKIYFLAFLLFAVATGAFAQSGQTFQLNKLSERDTLLSGWKVQPGDDMQWAQPGFDDSKWQAGDPSQDITEFKPIHQTGICWLRLHLKVDSNLAKQQITCWVLQYAASEIYLNGKLIRKYGTIASSPYKTQALCPSQELINLNLKPGVDEVIAVRLGYQASIPYISPFFTPLSAFNMYINSFTAAFDNYRENQQFITNGSIFVGSGAGIFLIISIIYLAYFMFDRLQRVNLYYFLFSLCIFFVNCTFVEFVGNIQSVTAQMLTDVFDCIDFEAGFFFMLLTIYVLFDYKPRAVLKVLIFIGSAFFICLFFRGTLGFILCSNVISILCFIEGARVAIWAIKHKKNGAVIILSGMLLSIIFQIWSALLDQATLLSLVLAVLSFAGFPFGMAIYLGIQYAFTNQSLRISLNDVKNLSAQNLLKEQEKQQILASQNEVLEQQVTERTFELNQSLINLKATQAQLIQTEKMASLGELTAGIAHEIQNPLNFVNNFSEVSAELTQELKEELKAGNTKDAIAIANDLEQNMGKISHHGKRADAIVKGMLQHSQAGNGKKELTDINALADECMRLAYHGLRSKDKDFNSELVVNFDTGLPKANVIPQDMSRVMLNLFNNAFYAVNQRKKTAGAGYYPMVTLETFYLPLQGVGGLKVRDNGNGIPDAIKEKIMQPFFTTKPTGEGTGLGLSLSYDIVVKGHGGTISVKTKENEFTEFTVSLPIDK